MFNLNLYTDELNNIINSIGSKIKIEVVNLNFWEFIYFGRSTRTEFMTQLIEHLSTNQTEIEKINYFTKAMLAKQNNIPVVFINLASGEFVTIDGIHRMFTAAKLFPGQRFPVLIIYSLKSQLDNLLIKQKTLEDRTWPQI